MNSLYDKYSRQLGKRLWKLAITWSGDNLPYTASGQIEVIRAIKQRKSVLGGLPAVRKLVLEASDAIRRARGERLRRRAVAHGLPEKAHYQTQPLYAAKRWHRPVILPTGPLADRLQNRTRETVLQALHVALDLHVSGSESYSVTLTTDPRAVTAVAETDRDWDNRYRGAYKGFAKTKLDCAITVPRAWLSRVYRRGLATAGGMLTLDAQALDCREPGTEVYAATWARQGRGKSLVVVTGYIARSRGAEYHGASYLTAVAGLRRKLRTPAEAAESAARTVAAFAARWSTSTLLCSVADARAIGACEYGIRSWCHAVGLSAELDLGYATAAQLAAGYQLRPLPEVRQTILYAARHRAAAA